jgi:hypothetical protein
LRNAACSPRRLRGHCCVERRQCPRTRVVGCVDLMCVR